MRNTESFIVLCSVCSQLSAGQGNMCPWLASNFGVLERGLTEGEPTLGGMGYNKIVMWGFVSVC